MRTTRRGAAVVPALLLLASLALAVPPPAAPTADIPAWTLDDLTRIGVAQNPRLAQAALAVTAARGRAVQAGLYPNPLIGFYSDELGDRTGPAGINTIPQVTQEVVTAGKLTLNRAAAGKETDQAVLTAAGQRAALLAGVRSAYFDLLALQRRVEVLADLTAVAGRSSAQARKLLAAKQVARLDVVQVESEEERLRADQAAAVAELPGAFRRLAAAVGVARLPAHPVAGSLDRPLPDYDLERLLPYVLSTHPEHQSAVVGIDRARLLLRRAGVEAVPNVTLSAGYTRQNQNQSDDISIGLSVPLPAWNRNQGNVRAAQAALGQAVHEVARVDADLADRLAAAVREYAAARVRAERYQTKILPRAREAYDLATKAYDGGQFDYLRVLDAQRSLAQADLDTAAALGSAWRAASAVSGLTLEEQWPPVPER